MKTILHVADIGAPRERVFEAVGSVSGLSCWWTTAVSGDAGVGGRIAFAFSGAGFDPVMEVTAVEAPERVEWKCVDGVEAWADNAFEFELVAREGGTRLRFRQDYATELSDDVYGIFNFNWGYYLESLRLYCEAGAGKPYEAPA